MEYNQQQCKVFSDERGNLIEFINRDQLEENGFDFGQLYILTFDGKDVVRGNHYHEHSAEVFCVIYGEAEIVLEDVETKHRISKIIKAEADKYVRIMIGKKIAHAIRSLSDQVLMVSFSTKQYGPRDEDKFHYKVL